MKQKRNLWLLALLAVLYFLTGRMGLRLTSLSSVSAAIWPPSGIALAAMLLGGYQLWPAVFIGAFLVNATTVASPASSFFIAIGNTLEGVAGAHLVNRYAHGCHCFEQAEDTFRFVALAGLLSPLISASIGVATLQLSGSMGLAAYPRVWLVWWLGDAVSIMTIAPPIVLWAADPSLRIFHRRKMEILELIAATLAAGALIFVVSDYPLTVLCIPTLIWAAFRLSQRETSLVVLLSAVIAAWGTASGRGPFVRPGHHDSILLLEVYMAAMAAMALPVAALVQEHRQVEKAVRAANRAKDEFMAMVSHELRNPLNTILLATHTLGEIPPATERAARLLKNIERAGQSLLNRANELLESTRIVAGNLLIEPRLIDLVPVIAGAIEIMQPAAEAKQIRIEPKIELSSTICEADGERLHQCVVNLLSNAIKFTPSGGTIELTLSARHNFLELAVRDSGAGIPADLLPHIFERHTQGVANRSGGLGLGLFIVKNIVKAHGGEVEARSEGQGCGATFIVRLPFFREAAAAGGEYAKALAG